MASPIRYLNALEHGSRLHEYEIHGILGSGGFGVTYWGYDQLLGKKVAIKEFFPNDLAVRSGVREILPKSSADSEDFAWGLGRFLEEARALASFDHPNIIRVYRFFRANGTGYIVMDYAEGETLRDLLERERVLTPTRLNALLFPLLDGLEEMHEKGFLHRDIKPGNIIVLKKDGFPVLIDFGAARQAINSKSRSVTAIVTPGYAPIEQYSTRGNQGPETDIYALAAVAYRAIVGERPDDATNRLSDDELEGWSDKVRGWDRCFLEAVSKGLSFKKEHRPHSIDEWRRELTVPGATRKVRIDEPRRRRFDLRWAAAAAAAVVLLSLVALLLARNSWFMPGDALVALREFGSNDSVQQEAVIQSSALETPSGVVGVGMASQTATGVERLIAAGYQDMAGDDLEPANIRNAINSFSQALVLDPDNSRAETALIEAGNLYVNLVMEALESEQLDAAEQWLNELGTKRPGHDQLASLSEQVEQLSLRQARERQIEDLLREGNAKLAENLLTTPAGNNAVEDFRQVLELEPANVDAAQGLAAVENRYVELILAALEQNNVEQGERLLESLLELNPSHRSAEQLRSIALDVEARLLEQAKAVGNIDVPVSSENEQEAAGVTDLEEQLWNLANESCSRSDFERYRDEFPRGKYIGMAFLKGMSTCAQQRASGQN